MRFGFKVYGCFGDVLYSTPVLKYLSKCHGDKLDIETDAWVNGIYFVSLIQEGKYRGSIKLKIEK